MSLATRALSIGSVVSAVIGGSLLHPVVTGATSSTTHQGDPIGVGLVPTATAFIALALLLGLLAYAPATVRRLAHSLGSTASTLAPKPSSFVAVVAALLLVSAAAGGGALGPDAQRINDRASPVQEADAIPPLVVGGAIGVGIAVSFAAGYVSSEYLAGDDPSDVYAQADATETHVAISTHVDSIAVAQNTLNAVMSNQVNDGSRSVAWAKGKAAAVKAMNDGANKSETKAAATAAINDYYASMETNVVNSKNESVNRLVYLQNVYENTSGLGGSLLTFDNDYYSANPDAPFGYKGTYYADYTTVNGSTIRTVQVAADTPSGAARFPWVDDTYLSNATSPWSQYYANDGSKNWYTANYEANVTPSTGSDRPMTGARTNELIGDIRSANTAMESNLDLWVDNTYDGYTAGDINDSDVLDPVTLAQEFSTSYNDTGYYAYAAGDLALQGTNGTLNHSMVFDLHSGSAGRTSNETLNGTLFTDWEPSVTNGSFVTGQTYNTSNANSLVYVATNDGLRVVQGEFHIPEMTNVQTGEATNSTDLQNYNRQTADAGWNESQYQQMLELRQELDAAQAAAAGGSGGSQTLLLVAVAAGAVALLARREGY